ncbi:hypothetical protein DFA_06857 [Cavenderia fasciculata]|uniref:Uncharacterized protein n=1 Tax=Cavenderia fasciculata TaxID=261658 RepID=F4PWV4_CACFS|nr:uncharacterized protein DFA_06857 [Cavenderia fasciculata]EGG19757.1 hypothetical protein DFA_06857 [Cavenderia fasciculata]|eukprot:XP_004358103.1 hypothetical protein DFA_06857 [Cavenderia fasciculata]
MSEIQLCSQSIVHSSATQLNRDKDNRDRRLEDIDKDEQVKKVIFSSDNHHCKAANYDRGCLSYTVFPPSESLILSRSSFDVELAFDRVPIKAGSSEITTTSPIVLLTELAGDVILWDKIGNQKYRPTSLMVLGQFKIRFTFTNLPLSQEIYFITNPIFSWQSDILAEFEVLGPRSIASYSTTLIIPPKPITNPFKNFCTLQIDENNKWWINDRPSQMTINPYTGITPKPCSPSVTACQSNPTDPYYYQLYFDFNLASGSISTSYNQFQFKGNTYFTNDLKVELNGDDTRVDVPVTIDSDYLSFYEAMDFGVSKLSAGGLSNYSPTPMSYVQGLVDQAKTGKYTIIEDGQTVNPNNINLLSMKINRESHSYLFKPIPSGEDININIIKGVILIQNPVLYVTCAPTSYRNSFSNNVPVINTTYHYVAADSNLAMVYESFLMNPSNTAIVRNLKATIGSDIFTFTSSSTQSSNGITFSTLFNDNDKIMISNNVKDVLIIEKTITGTTKDRLGGNITTLLDMTNPSFCNMAHGTGLRNQIADIIQSGLATPNVVVPIWSSVSGQSRFYVDRVAGLLKMHSRNDYAVATINIPMSRMSFLEPKITVADFSNPRTSPGVHSIRHYRPVSPVRLSRRSR